MQLHVRQAPDPALPSIVLLWTDSLDAAGAALPTDWTRELPLAASFAEADTTTPLLTPGKQVLYVGLGVDTQPEKLRKALHKALQNVLAWKWDHVQLVLPAIPAGADTEALVRAAVETVPLTVYQFLPYRKEADKLRHKLAAVTLATTAPHAEAIAQHTWRTTEAVLLARDLVNEPPNVLTATELANRAVAAGQQYGFSVEVFNKARIESLKMGGLLAVNRGSIQPPSFSILEWKPAGAQNSKPIVLVGKGVVFDTGGLSLKPTPQSMDYMKSDMAGAAAVIGAFVHLASNQVPLHVIGLIPSTDNRPGEDAYTPNDVITMYDGTTVEVLNTDAEGRMILADALSFAKQYDPALVIDLATLTGAAVIAVGTQGTAAYSTAEESVTAQLAAAGFDTHERIVHMPLWDEYREQLKSEIADMKNIGGRYAGSITAAKFLQHFTAYPWIHLDIAGPAWLETPDSYRGKGATGHGVRLLARLLDRLAGA